ncbi:hypothetical protein [Nocardia inohanensis]|uniref:hypothetical protein n=1 Tax=Nocardia inohanensis TaxID=209246 RepID=UPI00082F0BCF|nr:hypothetical protein [Nocardia inohanensis]
MRIRAHPTHENKEQAVPDLAVTLMVILGFVAAAMLLRTLAAAEANRDRTRAARPSPRGLPAMMDE